MGRHPEAAGDFDAYRFVELVAMYLTDVENSDTLRSVSEVFRIT